MSVFGLGKTSCVAWGNLFHMDPQRYSIAPDYGVIFFRSVSDYNNNFTATNVESMMLYERFHLLRRDHYTLMSVLQSTV